MSRWRSTAAVAAGSCMLLGVGAALAQGETDARNDHVQAAQALGSAIPPLPAPTESSLPVPAVTPPTKQQPQVPAPTTVTQPEPPKTAADASGVVAERQDWDAHTVKRCENPGCIGRDIAKDFWQVSLGVRLSWVTSAGFDPFATGDTLTHGSISGTRTVFEHSRMSVAVGGLFESGGRQSNARGASSSLVVARMGGVLEGRYHIHRSLYALAKFVPQATYTGLELRDASSANALEQSTWGFGLDSTAGIAWNFSATLGSPKIRPGFWLIGEFGYGYVPRQEIALAPDSDSTSARAMSSLSLGTLSLSGAMMRVGVAAAF